MTAEQIQLDPHGERCLKCGGINIDTGWECNDCGYDNRDWYYPPSQRPPEKLDMGTCKAGNIFPIDAPCPVCGAKPGDDCGGI